MQISNGHDFQITFGFLIMYECYKIFMFMFWCKNAIFHFNFIKIVSNKVDEVSFEHAKFTGKFYDSDLFWHLSI